VPKKNKKNRPKNGKKAIKRPSESPASRNSIMYSTSDQQKFGLQALRAFIEITLAKFREDYRSPFSEASSFADRV